MTKLHARATTSRPGHDPGQAELIGREAEMARIVAALAAARSGRGGAVFVTGEPGIGKSRLVAEAVAAATGEGMAAARGRAGTLGSAVRYRPLVEALLSLARTGLLPDPDELGRCGRGLARLLTDTRSTGAGTASHLMVAEAVLRVLAVVGRQRGCLLVLEDLHDADTGTLAVVEYLLDNIGQQPAMLLLSAGRASGTAAEAAARICRRGAAAILDLRTLGRPGVRLLIANELGIDPAEVGPELLHRVVTDSAGIPFVAKEIVHSLSRHVPEGIPMPPVPVGVADSVRRRAERLGPSGVRFLSTAALFGQRFPLPVVRHAIGCDDGELSAILRAGEAASLIVPGGSSKRWYVFRHRLVPEALLDDLGPGERAGYARCAVRALVGLYPGLPGVWCVQAARLHEQAGDTQEAIRLYCEAARRAMSDGTAERATGLLTRAHGLVDTATPCTLHATVLEQLLDTIACSARFDRLPVAATGPELLGAHGIPASRRAGLHARLADIALLTGRPSEAFRHLDHARRLLGECPSDAHTAVVDAAAAQVELSRLGPERLHTAAGLARRAADAAQRAGLPAVACRAMLVLGQLARTAEEQAAAAHFTRAAAIARAHGLPVLRISAELHLAGIAASHDGRLSRVEQVRQEALRMGALPQVYEADAVLALDQVRRCAFEAAGERIREGTAGSARLGLGRSLSMLWLVEAVRCAHRGRRAEMREALEHLAPLIDAAPGMRSMVYGNARAFCSLLEEEHDAAEQEFAQALAHDAENPATGEFGRRGCGLLLGVLAGRMGGRHYADAGAESISDTRWNRQFVGLAHAVLLGREGRSAEATAAAGAALEAAGLYPMARALCLRLVAESAYQDGWGAPVVWLREAEEYFHGAGIPAVAGACRALLRSVGAPVRQRRTGTELVPPELRRCGITAREFEVARLLTERIGNKDIAGRLHISPRTVEKHVASLLQKTGHPNRVAFASAASRDLVTGSGPALPDDPLTRVR